MNQEVSFFYSTHVYVLTITIYCVLLFGSIPKREGDDARYEKGPEVLVQKVGVSD